MLFSPDPPPCSLSEDALRFWASLPGWSPEEQAALLLGLDPDRKTENLNNPTYNKCLLLLTRAIEMEILTAPSASPRKVLLFADSIRIAYPKELKISVKHVRRASKYRKLYTDAKFRIDTLEKEIVGSKTRTSYEIIILLMALDKFGFRMGGNSKAANEIFKLTDGYTGPLISEDTIRAYLKEAADNQGDRFIKINGDLASR